MSVSDERQRRMVDETPIGKWNRLADAMGWTPESDVPSWMNPEQRAIFWRQVDKANREAIIHREIARLQAVFVADFGRPLVWLGGLLGRALVKLREVGR